MSVGPRMLCVTIHTCTRSLPLVSFGCLWFVARYLRPYDRGYTYGGNEGGHVTAESVYIAVCSRVVSLRRLAQYGSVAAAVVLLRTRYTIFGRP